MSGNRTKTGYMTTPLSMSENLKTQAEKLRCSNSYKQAVGKYLNAIMLDKKDVQNYFGLGMCYKNLGKTQKAID